MERMTIDQFNPNIEEVAQHVFLGPQADILERLESFNNRWRTNLRLTKKFYWAPGSYKEAKQHYADEALMFKMKPSGMHSIFDRMTRYSYYANNFKRDLLNIETTRKRLVLDKTIMTDNSDAIIESFTEVKNKMLELNLNDNCEVFVETYDSWDNYREYQWVITIILPENIMNVLHESGDNGIIGQVPLDELGLRFNIKMFKHLNWALNPTVNPGFSNGYQSYDRNRIEIFAIYKGMNKLINHPYINRLYMDNANGEIPLEGNYMVDGLPRHIAHGNFSNACFGDLTQGICESIYRQNWDELHILLDMWNSNYSYPHTGPLNNLRDSFNGSPKGYSKEFWNIVGRNDCRLDSLFRNQLASTINDKWSSLLTYCDTTECELRDTCKGYRKIHPIERSEEIRTIFKAMIGYGISHTRIQDIYMFLADKEIIEAHECMKNTYNEWLELNERISDDDDFYTFQECFEDELKMDDLRHLAKLNSNERKELTNSNKEAKVLESLLSQGLSAIPARSNPLINDDGSEEEPHNFRNNHIDVVNDDNIREMTQDMEEIAERYRELINDNNIEEDSNDEPFLNS